jgi:hypothetical protein
MGGSLWGLLFLLDLVEKSKRRIALIHIQIVSININGRVHWGIIDLRDLRGSNLSALYSGNNNIWRGHINYNNMLAFVIIDPNNSMSLDDHRRFVRDQISFLQLSGDIFNQEISGYNFPSPLRANWLGLISTHNLRIVTGILQTRDIIPTIDNLQFLMLGCVGHMVCSPWASSN